MPHTSLHDKREIDRSGRDPNWTVRSRLGRAMDILSGGSTLIEKAEQHIEAASGFVDLPGIGPELAVAKAAIRDARDALNHATVKMLRAVVATGSSETGSGAK